MPVIARSARDEAISAENKDCFAPLAMTPQLNLMPLDCSLVLNINHACQTCHKWPEKELKERVETIQERTYKLRNVAMDALMELIQDLKAAKGAGKTDSELVAAQDFQRKAQFYLDFVEAENSTGFHAPQEAARILGESINFSRKGQITLRDNKGEPRSQAATP